MYIFTIFLAIAWYMTSNIETMPSSSQSIPLYTYFLGTNLISMALLCLSLCFTISCYYFDPDVNDMPGWIRKFILEDGGKFFGIEVKANTSAWRKELNVAREWDGTLDSTEKLIQQARDLDENQEAELLNDENPNQGNVSDDEDLENDDELLENENEDQNNDFEEELVNDEEVNETQIDLAGGERIQEMNHQAISDIFTPLQQRELHTGINELLVRIEEKEDAEWKKREWEIVTEILDKAFLYFFSSVLALTIFGFSVHVLQLDGY